MKRFALVVALASVALLVSCSFNPVGSGPGTSQLSQESADHIVAALNAHDAVALKGMFTEYARAGYSAEIDDGLQYLLSMFPDGDVELQIDPDYDPSVRGQLDHGKKTTLVGGSYVLSSGGKDYTLSFSDFTVNTIDPDNVGIYMMGAVLRTPTDESDPELALHRWASSIDVDARASGPPGVFVGDSGGLSRDQATRIVDALNAHDAGTLKAMFTASARAGYSAQIDAGLAYLFSLFPNGDVVVKSDSGGSAICERIEGDKKAVLLPTFYTVSSGGVDYRLFFADFTQNTIDPDNVGIYAIGAAPVAKSRLDIPEVYLYHWSIPIYIGTSTPPGVFIPTE